jgi:aminopeptidase-like protein
MSGGMRAALPLAGKDCQDIGQQIYALAAELFPIARSLTGDGVRRSLGLIGRHVPLDIVEVPTGEAVFDWQVPQEWNVRDAYISDSGGRRRVDFRHSNLHVVGYSRSVHAVMPLAELKAHIFTLPEQPELIPYRTSYYKEFWGFCMAHRDFLALEEGDYEVCIDADHSDGHMSYGEALIKGQTEEEFLLSAHICHPSLANDNCSGLALLAILGAQLRSRPRRYSYRLIFAPGTIGAIAWLARNEAIAKRIRHGLVVSGVGDAGGPTYKRSRRGNSKIDRAMSIVLSQQGPGARVIDFSPYGYDERQYCSPHFDLPVGLFQRSLFGTYPEYHTSADNLDFIAPQNLESSYRIVTSVIDVIEEDATYLNLNPACEPQLGRRGLYGAIGGDKDAYGKQMAMLWLLNLCDGRHCLLDVAERSGLPFATLRETARLLERHALLKRMEAARQDTQD